MKKASCLPANAWIKQQSSNTLHVMRHRQDLLSLFFWQIGCELIRQHPFKVPKKQDNTWTAGRVTGDDSSLFRSISQLLFNEETQHFNILHRVLDYLRKHKRRFSDSIYYDTVLKITTFQWLLLNAFSLQEFTIPEILATQNLKDHSQCKHEAHLFIFSIIKTRKAARFIVQILELYLLKKQNNTKFYFPQRGIEPRPRPWKGHVLTDRLLGIKAEIYHFVKDSYHFNAA